MRMGYYNITNDSGKKLGSWAILPAKKGDYAANDLFAGYVLTDLRCEGLLRYDRQYVVNWDWRKGDYPEEIRVHEGHKLVIRLKYTDREYLT